MARSCWLFKSEPDVFSISALEKAPKKTTFWDGVRNYTSRNTLRDSVKKGDQVLFYHSSCDPMGVVGLATVVKEGYPDHTAFDPKSDHHDPKSDPKNPAWYMVDIQHVETFSRVLTLAELKGTPGLEKMMLTQRGSRLSIQPVTPAEFEIVMKLAKKKA